MFNHEGYLVETEEWVERQERKNRPETINEMAERLGV
jgi:hypothetical protein